jgi:non-ribosomal peptide synthetase component E (peptide arylation enzyme)
MSELGFYRFANSHPDEIAIVEPSEKIWTRGELLAKTNQLTHALKSLGLRAVMWWQLYYLTQLNTT